ncbi:hypothetical protein GN244_ATG00138 [Phytophthora infestans]|uniref:Uncharacterized protein n=1 Tax=Phytophthora infestans TaxID=4787 RepID=A0A833WNZ4_PHYIN|nr:hypothetical protein GN244_ATG00138 [Phytophthora infestans]
MARPIRTMIAIFVPAQHRPEKFVGATKLSKLIQEVVKTKAGIGGAFD